MASIPISKNSQATNQLHTTHHLTTQSFVRLYGSTLGTRVGVCETVGLNDYTYYPICGGNASAAFVRWDEGKHLLAPASYYYTQVVVHAPHALTARHAQF